MKKLLFSLLPGRDLIFTTTKGSGAGGQNRNKRETEVVLEHQASGSKVRIGEERYQHRNKVLALHRLVDLTKMKAWIKMQAAVIMQGFRNIEHKIDEIMHPQNLRVEYLTTFTCDKCKASVKSVSDREDVLSLPVGWVEDGTTGHHCNVCKEKSACRTGPTKN